MICTIHLKLSEIVVDWSHSQNERKFIIIIIIIIIIIVIIIIIIIIIYTAKIRLSISKRQRCLYSALISMFLLLMKSVTWFFRDFAVFRFSSYRAVTIEKSSTNDYHSF